MFLTALALLWAAAADSSGADRGGGPAAAGTGRMGVSEWTSPFDPLRGAGGGTSPDFRKPGVSGGAVHEAPDRWLGRDKAQHFAVSFLAAGAAGYAARHHWNRGRQQGMRWGFGAALSGGILKEICDLRHPRAQASLRDLAADLAGAAGGALLLSWW